jgi:hypothetical protein
MSVIVVSFLLNAWYEMSKNMQFKYLVQVVSAISKSIQHF